ncbi:hypothetical protein P3T18_002961 [Paraburkholderia sp. GAS199]
MPETRIQIIEMVHACGKPVKPERKTCARPELV